GADERAANIGSEEHKRHAAAIPATKYTRAHRNAVSRGPQSGICATSRFAESPIGCVSAFGHAAWQSANVLQPAIRQHEWRQPVADDERRLSSPARCEEADSPKVND